MYYYLLIETTDGSDVTLVKFLNRADAFKYIEFMNVTDFVLTDIVEQSGVVSGFEPEDYELIAIADVE